MDMRGVGGSVVAAQESKTPGSLEAAPSTADPLKPIDCPGPTQDKPQPITRERLLDGSFLAQVRARGIPGSTIRSDEELAESLEATLQDWSGAEDVWIFGYGSLIWNPAFDYAETRVAEIRGWHRRFCLQLQSGRGSPDRPGLMLALDRGGRCRGVAFRIEAARVRQEMRLIWQREMLTGSYHARWVTAHSGAGPLRAVTFVANRAHPRFVAGLTDAEVARRLATGSGHLGTCADYLIRTVEHLDALGLRDVNLQRLRAEVLRHADGIPLSRASEADEDQ